MVLLSLPGVITFEIAMPDGVVLSVFADYLYMARRIAAVVIVLYWVAKWVANAAISAKDQYDGATVFSHHKRVTVCGLIVSAVLAVILVV